MPWDGIIYSLPQDREELVKLHWRSKGSYDQLRLHDVPRALNRGSSAWGKVGNSELEGVEGARRGFTGGYLVRPK